MLLSNWLRLLPMLPLISAVLGRRLSIFCLMLLNLRRSLLVSLILTSRLAAWSSR